MHSVGELMDGISHHDHRVYSILLQFCGEEQFTGHKLLGESVFFSFKQSCNNLPPFYEHNV